MRLIASCLQPAASGGIQSGLIANVTGSVPSTYAADVSGVTDDDTQIGAHSALPRSERWTRAAHIGQAGRRTRSRSSARASPPSPPVRRRRMRATHSDAPAELRTAEEDASMDALLRRTRAVIQYDAGQPRRGAAQRPLVQSPMIEVRRVLLLR